MIIIKPWQSDKRYTEMYWSQADNEEEYIFLAKDLFREHDTIMSFSCDQWVAKEHLFEDDLCMWHYFFDTDACNDEKYETEDMPMPQEYNGDMKDKPSKEDYPVAIMFTTTMGKMITWYSIN